MDGSNLKLVYHANYSLDDGNPEKYEVSIREIKDKIFSVNCISPSDFSGHGGCYETALEDYAEKLDEYIRALLKFREEIIRTERSYTEVKELCQPDIEVK